MPGAELVLRSHGVNQIFVHMRTNFSEYRDEMNYSLGFPYSMYLRICVLVFVVQASRLNPFAHQFPQTFFALRLLSIHAVCNTLRQLLI